MFLKSLLPSSLKFSLTKEGQDAIGRFKTLIEENPSVKVVGRGTVIIDPSCYNYTNEKKDSDKQLIQEVMNVQKAQISSENNQRFKRNRRSLPKLRETSLSRLKVSE